MRLASLPYMSLLVFVAAVRSAMPAVSAAPVTSETASFGPFGTVTLYQGKGDPTGVVLFVSGDGGWNKGVVDMARALASLHLLVVGIDINRYLEATAREPGPCTNDAVSFEALSQYLQKKKGLPVYHPPVLVGYSSGATLIYALLVQAPAGTFAGGISLGFCPDLRLTKPPCRGEGLEHEPGPHGKGVSFLPAARLAVPWIALQGDIDQVCQPTTTAAFVARVGSGRYVALPKVGHGFSVQAHWMPQFREALRTVLEASVPTPVPPPASIADLPLVEVPATGAGTDLMAVMLSGDGGWAGLDRGVAAALAANGVPVVGWDSLQYYWKPHDPARAAIDLDRVLRHYLDAYSKTRVILVGYSFGADVLPFLVNRLPEATRARVAGVALVGCSHTAQFEFHLSNWIGGSSTRGARPTLPEIRALRVPAILCFYGSTEKDSVCPELAAPAEVVKLQGGHHLGGDYPAIARRILSSLGATQAPAGNGG